MWLGVGEQIKKHRTDLLMRNDFTRFAVSAEHTPKCFERYRKFVADVSSAFPDFSRWDIYQLDQTDPHEIFECDCFTQCLDRIDLPQAPIFKYGVRQPSFLYLQAMHAMIPS